jgi:hypothetical protein
MSIGNIMKRLSCFDVAADEELDFLTEVPSFHLKTLRFRL